MLFMVAAMAAEMERDLIRERTLDGLRAAEAQGLAWRPLLQLIARYGAMGRVGPRTPTQTATGSIRRKPT